MEYIFNLQFKAMYLSYIYNSLLCLFFLVSIVFMIFLFIKKKALCTKILFIIAILLLIPFIILKAKASNMNKKTLNYVINNYNEFKVVIDNKNKDIYITDCNKEIELNNLDDYIIYSSSIITIDINKSDFDVIRIDQDFNFNEYAHKFNTLKVNNDVKENKDYENIKSAALALMQVNYTVTLNDNFITNGEEAIDYVEGISVDNKKKIIKLTISNKNIEYELLAASGYQVFLNGKKVEDLSYIDFDNTIYEKFLLHGTIYLIYTGPKDEIINTQ